VVLGVPDLRERFFAPVMRGLRQRAEHVCDLAKTSSAALWPAGAPRGARPAALYVTPLRGALVDAHLAMTARCGHGYPRFQIAFVENVENAVV
jgi:hypothetical protein